jgi:DNA-directed RNA polymerase specialized sigma24 family protein
VHKVLHVVRDQNRLKRGGQFRELAGLEESRDAIAAVNQLVGREPSPEFAVEVAEEFERLIRALNSEELAQLAAWKLEGYTNDEIATKWGRATRTVERKLNLIRKLWAQHLPEE